MRAFYETLPIGKKRAVWARLQGMRTAGMAEPTVERLRIAELAATNEEGENERQMHGAVMRARAGRLGEPPAVVPG